MRDIQLFMQGNLITLIVILALLCLILIFTILKQRKEVALLVQQIREDKIASEKSINIKELAFLRAQTNPHFIFNSLASINDYIMNEKPEIASKHLTKLSKMMRMVLEHSAEESITLEEELKAMNIFVDLENMRLKNKVRFTIHLDPSIDKQIILLPPMLIQPFVENAIKHGISGKEEGGNIDLHISKLGAELEIKIVDNGIGRLESMKNRDIGHKSHGLPMTRRRIELLNRGSGVDARVEIIDHTKPSGTEVTLKIKL